MRTTAGAVAAATFVLAACVSGPAHADWEYTHWGMTPEQVAAASSGHVTVLPTSERTRDDADHWELAAQGTWPTIGRNLSVGFQFDTVSGGLECVLYNATGDDVAALKDVLVRKYGNTKEKPFGGGYSMIWTKPEPIEFAVGEKPLAAAVNHCRPNQP